MTTAQIEQSEVRDAAQAMLAALKAMVATVARAKGQPVTFYEGMRGCSVDKARDAIAQAEAAGIKAGG